MTKTATKKIAFSFFVFILSYLAAIQFFGESPDAQAYYFFFDDVDFNYSGRFEPLFVWLSVLIKRIVNDFSFFVFLIVFIGLFFKFFVLSKFSNFPFFVFLYLLLLFPVHELTQYRASLALGFLYLALYFLCVEKNKILVFLLFFSAIFLHYSVVAFLPFVLLWRYFSGNGTLKYWQMFFGLLFLFAGKLLIVNYVSELNSTLLSVKNEEPNIFSSRNIILFFILMIGVFNFRNIPKNAKPFFYISCYGFVLWWLFFDIPVFAHRLFEMTFFSYFIWLSFLSGFGLRVCQFLFSILSIYLAYKMIYIDNFFA
ncbi:EpsG family protein [Alicycliphilus denitrificans]|uniref:EpsG family protein n=1 Tax=Alicycliphilus denitrificans TaxID=179636 RepID=UPI00384C6F64